MLVVFMRALILYTVVVIVMRIMGKQQVAQLQPYELAVALMIADLGAVPMQNTGIPLITGIVPILTLLMAQVLISYLSLKSELVRKLVCGTPSILISKGKINEKELFKERYNVNDLLEQLRSMGYYNIADVEFAILETNGTLSVIPKSDKRPMNPNDLNLKPQYEGLPVPVIIDGNVNEANMKEVNIDMDWLKSQLALFDVKSIDEVLLASVDAQKKLYVTKKKDR
ncbi:Uncharacterized membrane protein YcaP, DUF421 family [Caldanaerobius fijiensis DSM 17918]|uniref:Uncharacterized membrane protein YcaP, DUF421 family n=1 Tax=Caldanaerobius fijiensis DSM 17918 TaxID=1121256 RepID=A0A1M5CTP3_9THEO|nr:DUF421 domain-containing protein [Caldanaerobius fijiensis]SHF58101.1 Uncharacterized membrane protein YcaP, DUF421 family [Caldanaerobius fijiensis DSM 17918]